MENYTIGIDIGGTNMKAVLWNGKKIVMDYSLATPKDTLDHLTIMINALVVPLMEKATSLKVKISGIGLSVAGTHDFKNKLITKSPNIPLLDNIKLGEILEEKLNIPVKMDNDGNCFLRAEAKHGAGKKYNNLYGIVISTGIGGSWYFNDNAYQGAHGGAGEPGSMLIDFTNNITVEKAYQKLNQNNSLNLATEAYRGDELAKRAYREIGEIIGITCANIINILDPEIIIIGGGTLNAEDLFLNQAKKIMSDNILNPNSKKTKKLHNFSCSFFISRNIL